jgi:hypothetical protein
VMPLCDLHLWMPREDERLVSSSFTSTTTTTGGTTCRLDSPQVPTPCSLTSSRTTSFQM